MTEPEQVARRMHPPCTACGQQDDHPRHVVINDMADDSKNLNQHLDCCADDGGCAVFCEPVLATANGATGLDLLPFVEAAHPATDSEG